MKRLTAVMAAAAIPLSAAAAPESFTIDPYHSFPHFDVLHLDTSLLRGRFDKTSGKITLDTAAKTGSVDLLIEAASFNSGDNDRGPRPRAGNQLLGGPRRLAVEPLLRHHPGQLLPDCGRQCLRLL